MQNKINIYPHFMIIGEAKTGTSSLYKYLSQHPKIHLSQRKEPHYFDNPNWNQKKKRILPYLVRKEYFKLIEKRNSKISGDCTPSYFRTPGVEKRIKYYLPKSKFIILFSELPIMESSGSYVFKFYNESVVSGYKSNKFN